MVGAEREVEVTAAVMVVVAAMEEGGTVVAWVVQVAWVAARVGEALEVVEGVGVGSAWQVAHPAGVAQEVAREGAQVVETETAGDRWAALVALLAVVVRRVVAEGVKVVTEAMAETAVAQVMVAGSGGAMAEAVMVEG